MNWADFLHANRNAMIFLLDWYPTQYIWLLNVGGSMQLYWFFLWSLRYVRLLLLWIKSQPTLLIKVSFIKDMKCCFEEITFSWEFFACLSCISFGQYFQTNIFKTGEGGVGKNTKRLWPYRGFSLEEGVSELMQNLS